MAGATVAGPSAAVATTDDPGVGPDVDSWSPEELDWYENQKPLGDAAWEMETAYPDEFSYAYFSADGRTLVIAFREEAPADVFAAFDATGLPYAVEDHVGYNSAEIQAVVARIAPRLMPPRLDIGVSVGPTIVPWQIRVTVSSDDRADLGWAAKEIATIPLPDRYRIVLVWEEGGPATA